MSWIIDKYITLYIIIITLTIKSDKFNKITMNSIVTMPNSSKITNIITVNEYSFMFQNFATSIVITIIICWFLIVLIDCEINAVLLCILKQYIIKMDDNVSLLLVFNIFCATRTIIFDIVTVGGTWILGICDILTEF